MIDCIHTLGLIPDLWGCDIKMSFEVMRGEKLKHPLGSLSGWVSRPRELSDIVTLSESMLKCITSHHSEPDLLLTHLMGSGQMG